MRKLSRAPARPSKRRRSCGTRHDDRWDAWGILAFMKRFLPSLVALLIAACATGSKTDGSNAQVEVDSHALLGDIAFERQQLDTATNEYLAAALLSDQPALAERATRVAHQVDLTEQGLKAVARWKALAPKDERPLWFAGVFETRAHRVDKATAEFESFIRELGDPGTGFALVLEALGGRAERTSHDGDHALAQQHLPQCAGGPIRARPPSVAFRRLRPRAHERESGVRFRSELARGAAALCARPARCGQDGRESRDRGAARLSASRDPGPAPVRRAAVVGGQAARRGDASQRHSREEARQPRSGPRARVPRAHRAASRRGEGALRRAARRRQLSPRGVLLPRPHRRDREGLSTGDALLLARDRRHARGRSAAAYRANHVRGAERPGRRGPPSARLRRSESALRIEHARGAGAAAAADEEAARRDEALRRRARGLARRPDACAPRTSSSMSCSCKTRSTARRSTRPTRC